jgi:hypothetical protein
VKAAALLLAAFSLLASSAAAQSARDPKTLVLRQSDLPAGFKPAGSRYVSNAQANRESQVKKDYVKLGRLRGYEANFQKNATKGILYVSAAASTYKTTTGAHDSFTITAKAVETSREPRFRRLSLTKKLGDEARLYKTTVTENGVKVDVFSLAWRSGEILSAVLGSAVAGTAKPADIVALGSRQQARIAG